jgi:hypothetical protein
VAVGLICGAAGVATQEGKGRVEGTFNLCVSEQSVGMNNICQRLALTDYQEYTIHQDTSAIRWKER